MLKACTYCGRVHDAGYTCAKKAEATGRYPKESQASRIRSLSRWQKTREYIKRRDHGVCQLCLINYAGNEAGALRPYEGDDIEVHHIVKIEEDASKAFDEYNLISLCRLHHEQADNGQIPSRILLDIAKKNSDGVP